MTKNLYTKAIIFSAFCFLSSGGCFADDFSSIKTINPDLTPQITPIKSELTVDLNKNTYEPKVIYLNATDIFYNFNGATDKFVQCNVRASWEDFKNLINNSAPNDFIYISIANKMADSGLFDLAYLAGTKVQDKEITQTSMDEMKRFYFPRKRLKLEDELILAEAYSNILYNDQSSEATNEILKNKTLLSTSDYANYLVALGSYKSGVFSRANQYIDMAIIQNSTNLNYQKLKAQILADGQTPVDALKIVDNLKKQNLCSFEYERKIKSLEQYVLFKNKKEAWEKNYHLGYYYYFENDFSRAIRTLQTALTGKKGSNAKVYGLMSQIYLRMNEFEKAADTAKKACKINCNNPESLTTLGDLSFNKKDYKQALKHYKHAASRDKNSYSPLVKEAKTYQALNDTKKAKELYAKVLKTHNDSWEAYYYTALLDSDKKNIYLKKALAINPLFIEGWIELAKAEIEKGNYDIAKIYLSNAYYIDENNFRYYYYEGLANKNSGDYNLAEYNFKKCLKLNAKCEEAQQELQNILNVNRIEQ